MKKERPVLTENILAGGSQLNTGQTLSDMEHWKMIQPRRR